jgi:hypothetical protein
MTRKFDIVGPLESSYQADRPLGLVLEGAVRHGRGLRVLAAIDCDADPQLPAGLVDVELELPTADGGDLRLRSAGQTWNVPARRVIIYEDHSESIRAVVPPQPAGLAYRLRWQLGMLLARLPLPRSWLG